MIQINDAIQRWNSKFIHHNDEAIKSLSSHIMDPVEKEHNMGKVNEVNNILADLFKIQENGQILLDLDNTAKLPASSIISMNN